MGLIFIGRLLWLTALLAIVPWPAAGQSEERAWLGVWTGGAHLFGSAGGALVGRVEAQGPAAAALIGGGNVSVTGGSTPRPSATRRSLRASCSAANRATPSTSPCCAWARATPSRSGTGAGPEPAPARLRRCDFGEDGQAGGVSLKIADAARATNILASRIADFPVPSAQGRRVRAEKVRAATGDAVKTFRDQDLQDQSLNPSVPPE